MSRAVWHLLRLGRSSSLTSTHRRNGSVGYYPVMGGDTESHIESGFKTTLIVWIVVAASWNGFDLHRLFDAPRITGEQSFGIGILVGLLAVGFLKAVAVIREKPRRP